MLIRSLHLENYRCFKEFDIEFDDRLTVLVGVNGAGKTATIDALSAFLEHIYHPANKDNIVFYYHANDIMMECKPDTVACIIGLQMADGKNNNTTFLNFSFNKFEEQYIYILRNQKSLRNLLKRSNCYVLVIWQVDLYMQKILYQYETGYHQ